VTVDSERLGEALTAVRRVDTPLEALLAAQDARELLPDWESHLARLALASGHTWESIGAALGISRQAAWERLRPGIAREIEAEKTRIKTEQVRLMEERAKKWPTKT
jgi:hypothetical protein